MFLSGNNKKAEDTDVAKDFEANLIFLQFHPPDPSCFYRLSAYQESFVKGGLVKNIWRPKLNQVYKIAVGLIVLP